VVNLQKALPKSTLVVIPLSTPILLGIYQEGRLIESIKSDKKASESLLPLLDNIIKEYNIEKIIYANGPGSYMATKLSYIMLRSIEIIKGIPLYSCSAFELNDNQPIKAIGNLYFIKVKEDIITKKFESPITQSYRLPILLDTLTPQRDSRPDYQLPAV
jgi:hypothetical protein